MWRHRGRRRRTSSVWAWTPEWKRCVTAARRVVPSFNSRSLFINAWPTSVYSVDTQVHVAVYATMFVITYFRSLLQMLEMSTIQTDWRQAGWERVVMTTTMTSRLTIGSINVRRRRWKRKKPWRLLISSLRSECSHVCLWRHWCSYCVLFHAYTINCYLDCHYWFWCLLLIAQSPFFRAKFMVA